MRSNAAGNSRVSHSSMRVRSDALGNRAATASGRGFSFKVASNLALLSDGKLERLGEVREDVVDVLDSDAQADAALGHARRQLLRRRHLPVGGRCGMAGEGLRISQ